MEARQERAVRLLGLGQCALWGALYYSFSVLLLPLAEATGQPRTTVAGGLSLALVVAAWTAPAVGRRIDSGRSVGVFRSGVGFATVGLLLLAYAPAPGAWAGWIAIGLASAMLLYEPAFGLVIRAVGDPHRRARSLATVTVLGGLASLVAAPPLAFVVAAWGSRAALLACAAVVLATGLMLERAVLPSFAVASEPATQARADVPCPEGLCSLALVSSIGTMAGIVLTTLLIPVLVERRVSATDAAWALGAAGIAQLPGRMWLARTDFSPRLLMPAAVVFQGFGIMLVAVPALPLAVAFAGVGAFGFGAGLQTVARPVLVERLAGRGAAGRWNGEVARIQGFARAVGPFAAVAAAGAFGTGSALTATGLLVLACLPIAVRLLRSTTAEPSHLPVTQ